MRRSISSSCPREQSKYLSLRFSLCNILILSFYFCRCLIHVGSVRPSRLPSGILGCLIREHYPGLVKLPDGTCEPAWTYNHYKFAKDNSKYPNVASRVVNEFWVSFFDTLLVNT
jgi:hypothetical protein